MWFFVEEEGCNVAFGDDCGEVCEGFAGWFVEGGKRANCSGVAAGEALAGVGSDGEVGVGGA